MMKHANETFSKGDSSEFVTWYFGVPYILHYSYGYATKWYFGVPIAPPSS